MVIREITTQPSRQSDINFIRVTANAGSIVDKTAGGVASKEIINLETYRQQFGLNFNTLVVTNTSTTSPIKVLLDGQEVAYVVKGNGIFQFDWKDGIIYNQLDIQNEAADGVGDIAAGEIQISIGRTGVTRK